MNNAYIRAQQCKVKEAKFPFVKIGEQYWTTKNLSLSVTPMGNTIPEMQANGNVEKIANVADREFSSDTGFWVKDAVVTIASGVAQFRNTTVPWNGIWKNIISSGKWYKITYTISNYSAGNIYSIVGAGAESSRKNSNGTYTDYTKSTSSTFSIQCGTIGASFDIDNVSVQEIGWSGSQELYDGIYAQTSGTVEQKTYAAVKAAAMWCNYNNNVPTGLIYGKLYNLFAVKLFQMDIDYYNAANPTKKWGGGWRVPTQSEFQTLSNYLGGDAVSSRHLREIGTVHWSSPNTGADNSRGFTSIGSGKRLEDGTFSNIFSECICWAITDNGLLADRFYINSINVVDYVQTSKKRGYSIRLIKA